MSVHWFLRPFFSVGMIARKKGSFSLILTYPHDPTSIWVFVSWNRNAVRKSHLSRLVDEQLYNTKHTPSSALEHQTMLGKA